MQVVVLFIPRVVLGIIGFYLVVGISHLHQSVHLHRVVDIGGIAHAVEAVCVFVDIAKLTLVRVVVRVILLGERYALLGGSDDVVVF